ncbi:hypothetical protein T484DRAFT_1788317, partial [Baffinella frigidus]
PELSAPLNKMIRAVNIPDKPELSAPFKKMIRAVNIPDKPELSAPFKKMIRALLARDPAKRMGSKHGAPELKKCEFLQDVKWASIRKETPP